MRAAAQANDAEALSAYINYESLREDLKSEFMAHMMAEAQNDKSGYGALGMAIGAMIGPLVDGMVSPAGVRAMLASNRHIAASGSGSPKAPVAVGDEPVVERRGFSEFIVTSKKSPTAEWSSDGMGWAGS